MAHCLILSNLRGCLTFEYPSITLLWTTLSIFTDDFDLGQMTYVHGHEILPPKNFCAKNHLMSQLQSMY